ncbi:MAG: glucosidase, partial [Thermomicrobiales bacterium]
MPMKVRSLVGLLPIVPAFPYRIDDVVERAPNFVRHARAFLDRHPELASLAIRAGTSQYGPMGLITLVPEDRLRRILTRMFDPAEFLSDYGIRSISKHYEDHPYELRMQYTVLNV